MPLTREAQEEFNLQRAHWTAAEEWWAEHKPGLEHLHGHFEHWHELTDGWIVRSIAGELVDPLHLGYGPDPIDPLVLRELRTELVNVEHQLAARGYSAEPYDAPPPELEDVLPFGETGKAADDLLNETKRKADDAAKNVNRWLWIAGGVTAAATAFASLVLLFSRRPSPYEAELAARAEQARLGREFAKRYGIPIPEGDHVR